MNLRFPRLPAAKAKPYIAEISSLSLSEVEARSIPDLGTEQFAATGVPRISADILAKMREVLRSVLRQAGYPQTGLPTRQAVDRALAVELASFKLPVGEMLRPDVWAWLSVYLLPEYVHWRWVKADGTVTEERFAGSVVRNALGRLWLRSWIFEAAESAEDRWAVVNSLSEDATVAILERTSVSSDHRLARSIARTWLKTEFEKGKAERGLRDAMIRARVHAALVQSSVLSELELDALARNLLRPEST